MKTLIIARHGIPDLSEDFNDLALIDRGVVEIYEVSKLIRDNIGGTDKIDRIYHSDTLRTLETAEILQKRILPKHEPQMAEWLNEDEHVLPNLNKLDNKDDHIILVTHEPNITEFLGAVYGRETLQEYNENKANDPFTTMNKAIIFRFNTDNWAKASSGNLMEIDVVAGSSSDKVTKNAHTKRSLADFFGHCAKKDLPPIFAKRHSTPNKVTVFRTPAFFR